MLCPFSSVEHAREITENVKKAEEQNGEKTNRQRLEKGVPPPSDLYIPGFWPPSQTYYNSQHLAL